VHIIVAPAFKVLNQMNVISAFHRIGGPNQIQTTERADIGGGVASTVTVILIIIIK